MPKPCSDSKNRLEIKNIKAAKSEVSQVRAEMHTLLGAEVEERNAVKSRVDHLEREMAKVMCKRNAPNTETPTERDG